MTFVVAFILLAWSPGELFAHNGLKGSVPGANSVVTTALRELRLEFTETPEVAFTWVKLTNAGGESFAVGSPLVTGTSLVFKLDGALPSGRYDVAWKTAGPDGHPVTGRFSFAVENAVEPIQADSAGPSVAAGAAPPMEMHHDPASLPSGGNFDAESPAYVTIRWFQFASIIVVLGALAFWHVVLGLLRRKEGDSPLLRPGTERAEQLALGAAAALILLAIVRLVAQSYAMHGPTVSVAGAMLPMVTGTTWGVGWLLQLIGATIVVFGIRIAYRERTKGWNVATFGGLAVAFSPGLSGHAASTPQLSSVAVFADALHVVGAGGWLGSLLFVLVVGIPSALRLEQAQRSKAVASIVNAFSPTALMFAGITATTGVFAAWLHIGSVNGLFTTEYGRTLLLKLGILTVVAATGAYNWLRVRPSLIRPEGAKLLTRTATIELAVAVLVLAVTAVLVATPTAMDEEMMRTASELRVSATVSGTLTAETMVLSRTASGWKIRLTDWSSRNRRPAA